VTLDEVVDHTRALDQATELPVSVDLENGYGATPEHVAQAILRIAEAGAVGASIEDYDPSGHIYEQAHAAERVAVAAEAARGLGFPFTLTGRAENLIRGHPDLNDTIARLVAYEKAGADVLYAPGLRSVEEIRAVCEAVSKPVNVLARPEFTLAGAVEAGARRVSVGGRLGLVGIEAIMKAALAIRDEGDFSLQDVRLPLQEWFTDA
jgi:2-methylisocitrate lyase-like PEP mutase family enzyme